MRRSIWPDHLVAVEFCKKLFDILKSENFFERGFFAISKSPFRYLVFAMVFFIKPLSFFRRKRVVRKIVLEHDQKKVLQELKCLGYANITNLVDKNLIKDLYNESINNKRSLLGKVDKKISSCKVKSHWLRLPVSGSPREDKRIPLDSIYVKFARQRKVLEVVSKFMKVIPSLHYAILTLGKVQQKDKNLQTSQLWHRDFDGISVIKMFVYLSDVLQDEDGPFCFVERGKSKDVKNNFFHSHLSDSKFFRYIESNEVRKLFLPKMSAFLVNTSHCYHMGGRQYSNNKRLLYTACYVFAPSTSWFVFPPYFEQRKMVDGFDNLVVNRI